MSYYIHNIPGRLRVRSAQIKRDSCQAANLCAMLESMAGIHSTELNKKAGSLIVHYDPDQLTVEFIHQNHQNNQKYKIVFLMYSIRVSIKHPPTPHQSKKPLDRP
jgi:hypothetical protein